MDDFRNNKALFTTLNIRQIKAVLSESLNKQSCWSSSRSPTPDLLASSLNYATGLFLAPNSHAYNAQQFTRWESYCRISESAFKVSRHTTMHRTSINVLIAHETTFLVVGLVPGRLRQASAAARQVWLPKGLSAGFRARATCRHLMFPEQ